MSNQTHPLFDTLIIGGGLAGLVAAHFLTQEGKKVAIIEKGKKLGGRASTTAVQQSYLNLGPHAFYKTGAASQILKEIGITPAGKKPPLNGTLRLDRHSYLFPSSPLALLTSQVLNWKEKIEFMKAYSVILNANWRKTPEISFKVWVENGGYSRKIKALLVSLLAISSYCRDIENIMAPYAIRQLQLSLKGGVLYLDGGWETLIASLEKQVTNRGVFILKGEQVKKINGSFPSLQIETSKGRIMNGKTIIYTAPPQELPALTEAGISHRFSCLSDLEPVKGVSLDLVLEKDEADNTSFAFDSDHFLYYSNHSKAARLSENYEVAHVFGYGKDCSQDQLEEFLNQILPGWQKRKVFSRCLTNLAVSCGTPNQDTKAAFAKVSSVMEGLFLAGDWCIEEGLLADASVSSGKRAALEAAQVLRGEQEREH